MFDLNFLVGAERRWYCPVTGRVLAIAKCFLKRRRRNGKTKCTKVVRLMTPEEYASSKLTQEPTKR